MDEEERLRRQIERLQQDFQTRNQSILTNSQLLAYSNHQINTFYTKAKVIYTETDLNNAVACENYELAAIIRDELNK